MAGWATWWVWSTHCGRGLTFTFSGQHEREHFLDKIHACHLRHCRGLKALIVFVSEFENILFLIHKLTTILVPCINVGLKQINHLKYNKCCVINGFLK